MAARGRKPKPLALKILEGYQADRTNFNEPRMPIGSTKAPLWLTGYALEQWNELAPLLAKAGIFTEGDRQALAQLCSEYDTIRLCMDGPSDLEEAEVDNWKKARIMLNNESSARDRYRRLLTEFGLTPSSRARLKSTVEPPKDKLAEHLDKMKKKA